MSWRRLIGCVAFAVYCFSVVEAHAQAVHDPIRRSSFFIKMTAQMKNGAGPLESAGTGFFVDASGLVLTSHHLLSSLEKQDIDRELGIEIRLSVGNAINPIIPAQIVDYNPSSDLMLLKIADENIPSPTPAVLDFGAISEVKDDTKLFTGGFPGNSSSWQVVPMTVMTRSGPGGYTWVVEQRFEGGRSGSAVYYMPEPGKFKVVGVVKGETKSTERGVFVPINQAESLLLPIRLPEIRKRLDGLTDPDKKAFNLAVNSYIAGPDGAKLLDSWLKQRMKEKIDEELAAFLDAHKSTIEKRFDGYMTQNVAYSYSSEFSLTGKQPTAKSFFAFPFYKANGDRGRLRCDVSYSSQKIAAGFEFRLNDLDPVPYPRDNQESKRKINFPIKQDLVADNRQLWDGFLTSGGSSFHKVTVQMDDSVEFEGNVTFLCTVIILGSAKFAEQ